jgi:hypothetical protein
MLSLILQKPFLTIGVKDGRGVYSPLRVRDLSNKEYLDHFYDSGKEHRQILGHKG